MNELESSKSLGPARTCGMSEVRADGSHLHRQVLLKGETCMNLAGSQGHSFRQSNYE